LQLLDADIQIGRAHLLELLPVALEWSVRQVGLVAGQARHSELRCVFEGSLALLLRGGTRGKGRLRRSSLRWLCLAQELSSRRKKRRELIAEVRFLAGERGPERFPTLLEALELVDHLHRLFDRVAGRVNLVGPFRQAKYLEDDVAHLLRVGDFWLR